MGIEAYTHDFEVYITGLCLLRTDQGTVGNVEVCMLQASSHHPVLTYGLDSYLAPLGGAVAVAPDARGNLTAHLPLAGPIVISPVGATPADPSILESARLDREGSVDFSLSHLCGADSDMDLDLSDLDTHIVASVTFRGGEIVMRKPVTNVDGDIPEWKRGSTELVFAEHIVWKTRSVHPLGVTVGGTTYEFARTNFASLSVSNLPQTAVPGSEIENFGHWKMFADQIGQSERFKAPEQAAGGISHGSQSCPPTKGTR